MRFSPQRRAIFRHLKYKKCFGPDVFCTFWLENVLLATAACNFSTSQVQKVLRSWCVLYIVDFKMCFSPQRRATFLFLLWPLDSAPAALTSLLFDWPDTRTIEKAQHFPTSLTFLAQAYLLSFNFWAIASSFCSLDYSTLLFNCPYCRKLDL